MDREQLLSRLNQLKGEVEPAPESNTRENLLSRLSDLRAEEQDNKSAWDSIKTGAKDLGIGALKAAGTAGEYIDRYTGAPVRKVIGKLQEDVTSPWQAVKAGFSQIGEPANTAPTGKEIATKTGLSPEGSIEIPYLSKEFPEAIGKISPAGIAGLGVDILADPTNVVPIGTAAKLGLKGVTKGALGTTKAVAKGTAKTVDYLTDTKGTSGVINSIEDAANALKSRFTPSQASDYQKLSAIASKNGIDPATLPEAVEFGKSSLISRASRKEAEGVMGEPLLKKHEAAIQNVNDALKRKVGSYSTNTMGSAEAGKFIRDSFDEAVDNVFKQVDFTYSSAGKMFPGLNVKEAAPKLYKKLEGSLSSVENAANNMLAYGVTAGRRTQGQQLLEAVGRIRASGGDYNTLASQLREIGEAAFKSKNILADVTPDIKNLRKLYGDLSDTLINTTGKVMGEDVAADLITNNKFIQDFLTDKSVVAKTIGSKTASDEQVFKQLIKNGDTKKIDALSNILGEDKMKDLKAAFINSLMKENIEGQTGFRTLYNTLRDKKEVANRLFSPEELSDLNDLLTLGDRMGIPILSTSGTGASQSFGSIVKELPETIANKRLIEKMKEIARNKEANVPRGTSTSVPQNIPTVPRGTLQAIAGYRRPPIELLGKAAQVYSVQQQNKDKDKNRAIRDLIQRYQTLKGE